MTMYLANIHAAAGWLCSFEGSAFQVRQGSPAVAAKVSL